MDLKGNTVLITGGATGIGFALAQEFTEAGSHVIICGRRQAKLREAQKKLPQIDAVTCDIANAGQRAALVKEIKEHHPDLNVLVNNAGIQRMIDLTKGLKELRSGEDEIATNFAAPIALTAMLIPMLLKKVPAAIINVSSGLGISCLSPRCHYTAPPKQLSIPTQSPCVTS